MNREFWINRWVENRIGFHEKKVNPLIERYWPDVDPLASGRVLVPLCGKSIDLRWLADRGHDVVGVDLSEIAAKAFFTEQEIPFTQSRESSFMVFRGKNITFYVGDFMQFLHGIGGQFDYFYDRAAVIALPPSMRPAYGRQLKMLLKPGSRGLLISLEYDPSESDAPPFSVSSSELANLFGGFQIDRVFEKDILEEEARFKERGIRRAFEVAYRLSRL